MATESNHEGYTIFWLDTPTSSVEQKSMLEELDIVKAVHCFTNDRSDGWFESLQLIPNETVLLVIPDMDTMRLAIDQNILVQAHQLRQVKDIYIDEKYQHYRPSDKSLRKVRACYQRISFVIISSVCIDTIRANRNRISPYTSRLACAHSMCRTVRISHVRRALLVEDEW